MKKRFVGDVDDDDRVEQHATRTWGTCSGITAAAASCDMCSRTTLSTKSLFAAPPLPTWKQSSDPANKLTIGESHVVLFTPCMSTQPRMCSLSRPHSNCVSSSLSRPAQVCECPVTVRPDRGRVGYRGVFFRRAPFHA